MATLPPSFSPGHTDPFINPPAAKKRKLDQLDGFNALNALKCPAIAAPIMERHDLVLDAFQKVEKASSYKEKISALDWLNKTLEMVPDYLSRFSRRNKDSVVQPVRDNQGFPRINGLIAANPSKSSYFRAFLRSRGVPHLSENGISKVFAALNGRVLNYDWLKLGKLALRAPGLSINQFDDFWGLSPFHELVSKGQNDLLKETLKAPGINPNVFKQDLAPLHVAVVRDNAEAITILLTHPKTNPNLKTLWAIKSTSLHHASTEDRVTAIEALLKGGAGLEEKDSEGYTPLHWAAFDRSINALAALIQAGANLNAQNNKGRTPAHLAAEYGQTQALRTLIEAGSDLNEKAHFGLTPLHLAAKEGKLEAVNLLLAAGASPDQKAEDGRTPLMSAIIARKTQIALSMLHNGANINLGDELGSSALHYAICFGNMTLVNEVLDRNAQFDIQDTYGCTPLHVAIMQHNRPAAARLMALQGTVNTTDNLKRTALHYAAYNGQSGILEDLLRHAGRISHLNTPDQQGNTPLYLAIFSGDVDTVRLLLEQPGIQLSRKNKWNETPLDFAKHKVKSPVMERLLSEALDR